jgi:arginyl-tRNA synthetase
MKTDLQLQHLVSEAVATCFQAEVAPGDIQIQQTRREFEGDRTVVVFPLTRVSKLAPPATAEALGAHLVSHARMVVAYQVVQGFLNLTLAPEHWLGAMSEAVGNSGFGLEPVGSKPQILVEYSSPNTNKPLHLGHLRNNFLGYAVARILEAHGHPVVKAQIINDRGIHICKSMVAWKHFAEGETPESSGLKGDKLVGKYYVAFDVEHRRQIAERVEAGMEADEAKNGAPILVEAREMLQAWEAGDPEVMGLWKTMNGWVYDGFNATYQEMGVSFDQLYYESDTYLLGKSVVEDGLARGVFYQKENGSVWIDLTEDGLDEKLLLRADGTSVYMTQDIGTAIQRFNDFPGLDRQVYTVGNEQEYHFKVLFLILKKLGFEQAERNFHLSYGMVELPDGKMKSREGRVVDADDLLEEMAQTARAIAEERGRIDELSEAERTELYKRVGYGALKFYLLKVAPIKGMQFDPEASIDFLGNTGPFIQFNFVRALSMLRRAGVDLDATDWQIASDAPCDKEEILLIQKAIELPDVISESAASYDPSHLANYCSDLTRAYSSWYNNHPVLNESDEKIRSFRLALSALCARNLRTGMGLLGIEMPDRM